MDKKQIISTVSKHSSKLKYIPVVKKDVTMVINMKKNKGKLTKGKVNVIAAGGFVVLCLVKRFLKY